MASRVSSNAFAHGSNKNASNFVSDTSSTRVHTPPGGRSSLSLVWEDPPLGCQTQQNRHQEQCQLQRQQAHNHAHEGETWLRTIYHRNGSATVPMPAPSCHSSRVNLESPPGHHSSLYDNQEAHAPSNTCCEEDDFDTISEEGASEVENIFGQWPGSNQNCGSVITEEPSTCAHAPISGRSPISVGRADSRNGCVSVPMPPPSRSSRVDMDSLVGHHSGRCADRQACEAIRYVCDEEDYYDAVSKRGYPTVNNTLGQRARMKMVSSISALKQNCGNVSADLPSTRVRAPTGDHSSISLGRDGSQQRRRNGGQSVLGRYAHRGGSKEHRCDAGVGQGRLAIDDNVDQRPRLTSTSDACASHKNKSNVIADVHSTGAFAPPSVRTSLDFCRDCAQQDSVGVRQMGSHTPHMPRYGDPSDVGDDDRFENRVTRHVHRGGCAAKPIEPQHRSPNATAKQQRTLADDKVNWRPQMAPSLSARGDITTRIVSTPEPDVDHSDLRMLKPSLRGPRKAEGDGSRPRAHINLDPRSEERSRAKKVFPGSGAGNNRDMLVTEALRYYQAQDKRRGKPYLDEPRKKQEKNTALESHRFYIAAEKVRGIAHCGGERRSSSTSTCDETPRGYEDSELSDCDSLPLGAEWCSFT